MNIIGISAFYHEAACCLLQNGRLVAAAAEERFSRIKHDPHLPVQALRYCLEAGQCDISQVDAVAFYEVPEKKADRQRTLGIPSVLVNTYIPPDNQLIEQLIRQATGLEAPLLFFDHHMSHAASAYFYSGFDNAAILTVDGVGEWTTTAYGAALGSQIDLFETVDFPHSLGLLYATITAYLGFRINNGEYKVMGLAAYGQPRYIKQVQRLVQMAPDGQFQLEMAYFDFVAGERMYSAALCDLFGRPARTPETPLTQFHCDVAKSVQTVLETILLQKIHYLGRRVASPNLCLAGGVALNCVANGRIRREGPFEQLFVQPAAGDAGGCLGAAALAHLALNNERPAPGMLSDVKLGPQWSVPAMRRLLTAAEIPMRDFHGREPELLEKVVDSLIAGHCVGWFQGRMEFGPRALGARSILANPLLPGIKERINAVIKRRETFRPFAPSVLASQAATHFELDHASPFMLETCQLSSPLDLPGIAHIDNSARPQTVDHDDNPRFHALLQLFFERTGCPILLNTSFNVRGEPIVCSPADALLCFGRSQLDLLVLEDFVIERSLVPDNWDLLCTIWSSVATPSDHPVQDSLYTFV